MTDPLDTLRPEVREAVEYMDRGGVARIAAGGWRIIRAELLRLVVENHELRAGREQARNDRVDEIRQRVDAEAELAALKAAIAGSARVEVTLGCAIDGEIPPDLALCKVALVKTED